MLCIILLLINIETEIYKKIIPINLAILQTMPIFVYELFETMQSSVTRSRTSISKSLPASFTLSVFILFSESYI